jgi:hypothetical protein
LYAPLIAPRENWDQGDIVDAVYFAAVDRKLSGVLLTPACDIEHQKGPWTFAALFPDSEVAYQIVEKRMRDDRATSPGAFRRSFQDSLRRDLGYLVTQRYPRYHWLPAFESQLAMVADFTYLTSVIAEEVKGSAKRVASMTSSWREQIPARYAAFMGRVGTFDHPEVHLTENVERLLATVIGQFESARP